MTQPELATDRRIAQARGFTLWFTGLSGAGKSTLAAAVSAERSEERRVGKECRSRWSPYH